MTAVRSKQCLHLIKDFIIQEIHSQIQKVQVINSFDVYILTELNLLRKLILYTKWRIIRKYNYGQFRK